MFFPNQLKLSPIDQFPFVKKWFIVHVYLAHPIKEPVATSLSFRLTLYAGESADQLSPVENGIEISDTSKLEIPLDTAMPSTAVTVRIMEPSGVSLFNARKYFLVAQPSSSEHFEHISSGFSDPLVAVNYRLLITNGHELPSIFYNATKGKGNKMEIKVKLVDSEGNAVTTRPNLKLNCVLHYEDNTTVDQSEKKMLEITSDSKLFIGETGETSIRFRIVNAVSRKHGNKKFKVSVSADSVQNAARYNDVSFDYSPCIDVRTKVDAKARERRMAKKICPPTSDFSRQKPRSILEADGNYQSIPQLKKAKTGEEQPLSLSSYMGHGRTSLVPFSQTGFSFVESVGTMAPPSLVKMWTEDIMERVQKLRWVKAEGNSKADEEGLYKGYKISNPNESIDEIINIAQNILKPAGVSEASSFDHVAQNVTFDPSSYDPYSSGPSLLGSRNHSLALNP